MSQPDYPLTFTIGPEANSITCLGCGLTSYNPNDVKIRWCGHCHVFHDDIFPPARQWFIDNTKKAFPLKPK